MSSSPRQPFSQNILITTPRTISHHSPDITTLFSCTGTNSIVAARASPTPGSPVYAVASNHVVLLCSAARRGKAYTLRTKRSDRHDNAPHLLFSPDAHFLYFTTALTTSVQAYHIPTASLLPPLAAHPSPPTVLAISTDGRMLLSASARPPIKYVHDVKSGRSVELEAETQASVKSAAFQNTPEGGETTFVLGMKNGNVAVYRFSTTPSETPRPIQDLQPTRIGLPTRLHSAAMGGVCAAEFLPGFASRIVSLGFDSRCRIAEFECAGEAKILRTWSIDDEATCLSLSHHTASNESGMTQCLIAIGSKEGTVSVFNMLGLLVHEIKMMEPIVSVQFVGDMGVNSADQGPLQAGAMDDEAILRLAPALRSSSTHDLFLTSPTRISSLCMPRRPTHKRPRVRPSTFEPPTMPGRFPSTSTPTSLVEADSISIEDGTGNATQSFTPESTQHIHSITTDFDTHSNGKGKGERASGSVYSPATRISSLSSPQRRKSEKKKSVDVVRKRVGVYIRKQTETPEWLTPRPVPVPVPATNSFPFAALTRSPPPVPPASSSVSPLSTPQAVTHRLKNQEEEMGVFEVEDDGPSRDGDIHVGLGSSEAGVVRLRKDHEDLKAEVSILRREVSEIKALLSPQAHPQVHLRDE